MLRNLTIRRQLCFHKHRRANRNAYLNIYSQESLFLLEGNSTVQFIEMVIQKIFMGLERMEVLITSLKVFLGNKYNSYIHTARNAKLTSTRIFHEKTVMKWKVFRGVLNQNPLEHLPSSFFRKQLFLINGVTKIHS